MTAVYRWSAVAVRIKADNDRSGNPQRGWLVYKAPKGEHLGGDFLGFVDEGYGGQSALREAFPRAREVAWVPTSAAFYRECMNR